MMDQPLLHPIGRSAKAAAALNVCLDCCDGFPSQLITRVSFLQSLCLAGPSLARDVAEITIDSFYSNFAFLAYFAQGC